MGQTSNLDGIAGDALRRQDGGPQPPPVPPDHVEGPRRRTGALIVGGVLCFFALVLLVGGAAALWKDQVDRDDDGFVSFGSTELQTGEYAIVGDLRGDGPAWLYGSTVLGDTRVRATSQSDGPLFIGIARSDDVDSYLDGVGYATVEGFEVSDDTTRSGGPPSAQPSDETIWAASTEGTGEQTLTWGPRDGHWSVVLMNADAEAGVDVEGDASAELPVLTGVAVGLLVVGGALAAAGIWVFVWATKRRPARAVAAPSRR
jgi:hypothetical protein